MNKEHIIENINVLPTPKLVEKITRFGNHIIDTIGFFFIIFLHAMLFETFKVVIPEDGSTFLGVYTLVLYVMYHTLFEHYFSKTPGKFLTKTRVVTIEGNRPSFLTILRRNLCRLIPLDNISFLISKRGWHDEFSKTMVVYDN
jgi:uncharacterized RDD family membrane protein YckC